MQQRRKSIAIMVLVLGLVAGVWGYLEPAKRYEVSYSFGSARYEQAGLVAIQQSGLSYRVQSRAIRGREFVVLATRDQHETLGAAMERQIAEIHPR